MDNFLPTSPPPPLPPPPLPRAQWQCLMQHDPMSYPLIRDLLVARTFRRDSATRNTGTWLSEPVVEQVLAGHLPPMLQVPGAGGFAGSPVSAERGAVRGETEVERSSLSLPQTKATEMRKEGEEEEGVAAAENKGAERARQWISPSGELLVDGGIVAKWETCVVVEGLGSCWETLRQDLVDLFEDHRVCGEAIIFGTAKSHLILVYLWTEEARQDAIVDLHNAVIEKTTRLQLRRGETEDLKRALQLQSI